MGTKGLRKVINWKNIMRGMGVQGCDMGKAVGLAIENRWISPGTGNLSTDSALKRLRTTLQKHGVLTNE